MRFPAQSFDTQHPNMTLGTKSLYTKRGITIMACTTGFTFFHQFHGEFAARLSSACLQLEDPFMAILAAEALMFLMTEIDAPDRL